ncbi:MAG: hypothetical protein AB2A00_02795 [Myxococcota bacterium]
MTAPSVPTRDPAARMVLAMHRLQRALWDQPVAVFQRVGGPVELIIATDVARVPWALVAREGRICVVPEQVENPVLRLGLTVKALERLVDGTLDVRQALEARALVVEDPNHLLPRLAACFAGLEKMSALGARVDNSTRKPGTSR